MPRARRLDDVARPLLAGALSVGLVGSGVAYAAANNVIGSGPAAVVFGSAATAHTNQAVPVSDVETINRATASVSRNERRTALPATRAREAKELAAKQKADAARKAKAADEAKAAADRAARDRARLADIASARKNPQAAARSLMATQGWTSDAQYRCLVNLWIGESDWRWSAENRSSGAYGIPQSLPARKMAQMGADYRTNPVTQIKWGLWYIKMSYGTPCNAWSTWQARSPHWY